MLSKTTRFFRSCCSKTPIEKKMSEIKNEISKLKKNPFSVFDENIKNKLSELSEEIIDLFHEAKMYSQLKTLLMDFVKNTNAWVITINDPFSGKYTYLLPFLNECACVNSDNFNRTVNKRREKIENSIENFIKLRFQNDKNPINYLSFGAGGLLQDFIILVKLIIAGYNINVNLVDRAIEENTLKQFKFIEDVAKEMKIKINISSFKCIDDFNKQCLTPQSIVTAIDCDDFYRKGFNDVMKAQRCLESKGQMFLSVGEESFVFSKNSCLDKQMISSELKSELNKFNDSLPTKKDTQSLRISILDIYGLMHLLKHIVIPYVSKHSEAKELTLTIPHPQEVEFFGSTLGSKKPNLNMSNEHLGQFLCLFLSQTIKVVTIYVRGNRNFDKLLPQYDSNQDLVICYGKVTRRGIDAVRSNVKAIHKKFPHAHLFCGMKSARIVNDQAFCDFGCEWIWDSNKNLTNIINFKNDNSKMLIDELYSQEIVNEKLIIKKP